MNNLSYFSNINEINFLLSNTTVSSNETKTLDSANSLLNTIEKKLKEALDVAESFQAAKGILNLLNSHVTDLKSTDTEKYEALCSLEKRITEYALVAFTRLKNYEDSSALKEKPKPLPHPPSPLPKPLKKEVLDKNITTMCFLLENLQSHHSGKSNGNISRKELLLTYHDVVSSEDLFTAIIYCMQNKALPLNQKEQILKFAREWLECGLYDPLVFQKSPCYDKIQKLLQLASKQLPSLFKKLNKALAKVELRSTQQVLLPDLLHQLEFTTPQVEPDSIPELNNSGTSKENRKTIIHQILGGSPLHEVYKKIKDPDEYEKVTAHCAEQLAIAFAKLRTSVPVNEYLVALDKEKETRIKAPHIAQNIALYNKLTNFIACEILRAHDMKAAKQIARFFIDIAYKAFENGDYETASAIQSVFNKSDIDRLKIKSDKKEILANFFSPIANFKVLRQSYEKDPLKQIILFPSPVTARDLTAWHSNPVTVENSDTEDEIFNLDRLHILYHLIAPQVNEAMRDKAIQPLDCEDPLLFGILTHPTIHEDFLYEKSQILKPRKS